jgi:hypothetical protein
MDIMRNFYAIYLEISNNNSNFAKDNEITENTKWKNLSIITSTPTPVSLQTV